DRDSDQLVGPECDRGVDSTNCDESSSLSRAKSVVTCGRLLIVGRRRDIRSRVAVVVHLLITQRGNRKGVSRGTYPRTLAIAVNAADGWCGIRVVAVGVV